MSTELFLGVIVGGLIIFGIWDMIVLRKHKELDAELQESLHRIIDLQAKGRPTDLSTKHDKYLYDDEEVN